VSDIVEIPPAGGQPLPNAEGVVEFDIEATYTPVDRIRVRDGTSIRRKIVKYLPGGKPVRVYTMVILRPSGDTWLSINQGTDRLYVAFWVGDDDGPLGELEFDE